MPMRPDQTARFATTPVHLYDRARLQGFAETVKHEPCGPLSNTEVFRDLVGADAVLAINEQPERRKPLVSDSGESSKIVPSFTVNCLWHSLHFHRAES